MKHKPALYALERLHAELGGQILQNKREARRLAQAMVHVEAVLKMLEPGYDVRPIAVRRRKQNPYFKRGTVFRAALDVMRVAERPLTTREIVGRMLTVKGVVTPSAHDRRTLEGGVYASLHNHNGGLVQPVGKGIPARWKITG
jgi:hypothetical protein